MNTPGPRFDILGFGAVTLDDFAYIDAYPPADAKVAVRRKERQCGGLTGTALVAAARLGGKCAYAGVLGTDEISDYLIRSLESSRVDVSHVRRDPAVRPIHAFIVVDETHQTRNIFVDLNGGSGAGDQWPPEEFIRSTRVLFVDHIGVPGMLRAAQLCRSNGIPVVADFERTPGPDFPKLLAAADHVILSRTFAAKLTGESTPERAARSLFDSSRTLVAVTGGHEGCWYIEANHPGEVQHQPAFTVEVVDTTGCGDVFHGAYALALSRGDDVATRIRFASAAAAIKATHRGGQAGIPGLPAVNAFLNDRVGRIPQ